MIVVTDRPSREKFILRRSRRTRYQGQPVVSVTTLIEGFPSPSDEVVTDYHMATAVLRQSEALHSPIEQLEVASVVENPCALGNLNGHFPPNEKRIGAFGSRESDVAKRLPPNLSPDRQISADEFRHGTKGFSHAGGKSVQSPDEDARR